MASCEGNANNSKNITWPDLGWLQDRLNHLPPNMSKKELALLLLAGWTVVAADLPSPAEARQLYCNGQTIPYFIFGQRRAWQAARLLQDWLEAGEHAGASRSANENESESEELL